MKNCEKLSINCPFSSEGIPTNPIIRKLRLNLSRSSKLMSFFLTRKEGRRLTCMVSPTRTITVKELTIQTMAGSRQIRLKKSSVIEVTSTNKTSVYSTNCPSLPSITRQTSYRRVKRLHILSCSTRTGALLVCGQLQHSRR